MFSKIWQNLISSNYFYKNGPFISHVSDKLCLFCNKLTEKSTLVNFCQDFLFITMPGRVRYHIDETSTWITNKDYKIKYFFCLGEGFLCGEVSGSAAAGGAWPSFRQTRVRIFLTFKELKNRFHGTISARLCSLAGRYDNPIPTRFFAPIDCLKSPTQVSS
jgi:hypothetical protein